MCKHFISFSKSAVQSIVGESIESVFVLEVSTLRYFADLKKRARKCSLGTGGWKDLGETFVSEEIPYKLRGQLSCCRKASHPPNQAT